MDGSSPREGGVMKPVVLKVCVAFVLSATGLIMARFVSRKDDNEVTSSASNQESSSSPTKGNEGEETESLGYEEKQEILRLKSRFEEIQRKEYKMEMRFERYCILKDQELMLLEYKSKLSLEKSQLDFFRREVSAMEEELRRGQELVMVYLKMVGEIKELRTENGWLEVQAKKLRRRTKHLCSVVKEKNMRIIGAEKELSRCFDELETKNDIVKELEGEVMYLKAKVDVLEKEKEDVSKRLSNSKSEIVSVEDYTRLLVEYEGLKKELKEVINLRWSNALRNGTSYGEIVFSPNGNLQEMMGLEDQTDALALTLHDDAHHHHHETSKRKWLMKKLKRWVEGNDKGKSTKIEERCFGRHSITAETEEEDDMFHSRRSCSSV